MSALPPLIDKALTDAGYDLVDVGEDGWVRAHISGDVADEIWVRVIPAGTLLAMQWADLAGRIGLLPAGDPPAGARALASPTRRVPCCAPCGCSRRLQYIRPAVCLRR